MTRFGRSVSVIALTAAAALTLVAQLLPGFMHVGPIHIVDWLGLLIYVSAPLAWISALWHWARNFPPGRARVGWGIVAFFGLIPGGIAYWFWGAPRAQATESTSLPDDAAAS